ncbi:MAG: hypothetical protein ACOCWG_01605 [bacterium]
MKHNLSIGLVDKDLIDSNIWLKRAGFEIYVRKSRPELEGKRRTILDIANIEIPKKFRNRGWFTSFRTIAERVNPWEGIRYENVWTDYLFDYFKKEELKMQYGRSFYILK